jgi:putative endonuclease
MLRTPLDYIREALSKLGREADLPEWEGLRGVGQRGEALAIDALVEAGYEIVERNFRTPIGEIDVIAREGGVLCFVEVKWRRDENMGHPAESVTPEKQRRLARTAEWYLAKRKKIGSAARFDVVAILEENGIPRVEIVRNAFEGPYRPRRRR